MTHTPAVEFALGLTYDDIPVDVQVVARRCLLDLTGVAISGSTTLLSRIVRDHAVRQFAASDLSVSLILDGRQVSPLGAALSAGMTIDSIDAHDGHPLTKGHAGCGVLPTLLALAEAHRIDDEGEFLTLLVIGYELATRAGMALHHTASDYHMSGAWVALGCAGIGARVLGLSRQSTSHALGIAEYHGPRGLMMRAVDHPTMVKDGSGWGSLAGLSAAYLAADGFTGAPALTVEDEDIAYLWDDLGEHWRISEQYFKLYPVCRWAQPPVEAVMALMREHDVTSDRIDHLEVASFDEAVRLATARPTNTEEAQYSLPWAVAAAAVRGRIGIEEISGSALEDPEIVRLSISTRLIADAEFNNRFPQRRFASVTLVLVDGSRLASPPTEALGGQEAPLSDAQIATKYVGLAEPVLGSTRSDKLADLANTMGGSDRVEEYIRLLTAAPTAE